MTRLTKKIREEVAEKAAEMSAPAKRMKEINGEIKQLCYQIACEAWGGEAKMLEVLSAYKKQVAELNKLPEIEGGYHFNGLVTRISYHVEDELIPFRETTKHHVYRHRLGGAILDRPVVMPKTNSGNVWDVKCDDKGARGALARIKLEQYQCWKQKNEIGQDTLNALNSFTTVEKLVKEWPEIEELLPQDIYASKRNLPAVKTADLNAKIGLPSNEQATA